MKKAFFLFILFTISNLAFAQSLEDINDLMGKNDYRKAREAIDKFIIEPKNASKSDAWYFKGRIYNSLSKDSTIATEDALNLKGESFNSYKKLQLLDKLDLRLKLENYISYFDLYNGFFDIAAKAYNGKNYALALKGFKNALIVEDYVRVKGYEANGYKFPALDTSLVMNTAICAKQANNIEESDNYYKTLADANVFLPNYLNVYTTLAESYYKKNDVQAFNAIVAKGKAFFPQEPYWDVSFYDGLAIDNAIKGLKKEELLIKYEELMGKYPTNFIMVNNYGIELYKYIYSPDVKSEELPGYKSKLLEVLKKAISINSTADDNFLMANYLYNNSFDLTELSKKIKGLKPDDVKKRAELNKEVKKAEEDCIPYALKAVELFEKLPKMKTIEKVNYKQSLEMLAEIYRVKGDVKKSAEYKARQEAVSKF